MSVEALARPVRTPPSLADGAVGSIHDDTTAREMGFRGDIVAGSVPADRLPPLVLHLLANGVFDDGSQSPYLRYATKDGELAGSRFIIIEQSAPDPDLGHLGQATGREVVRPDHNCPHWLGGSVGNVAGRR